MTLGDPVEGRVLGKYGLKEFYVRVGLSTVSVLADYYLVDAGTLHFYVNDKTHGVIGVYTLAPGCWSSVVVHYAINGDLLIKQEVVVKKEDLAPEP